MDVVNKDMKLIDAQEEGGYGLIVAPMRGTATSKKRRNETINTEFQKPKHVRVRGLHLLIRAENSQVKPWIITVIRVYLSHLNLTWLWHGVEETQWCGHHVVDTETNEWTNIPTIKLVRVWWDLYSLLAVSWCLCWTPTLTAQPRPVTL